jgi:hypothetical protein
MIGDGVIAESTVTFNISWRNPGNGSQPEWDQNGQDVQLHAVSIYPDLSYTAASATATYFKYTSANKILELINLIDSVIDSKLQEQPVLEAESSASQKSPVPQSTTQTDQSKDASSKPAGDAEDKPKEPEASLGYTVEVTADRLVLTDIQRRGGGYAEVQIIHKVSENMTREIDDNKNSNSQKIRAIVKVDGLFGSKTELSYADFNAEDGRNLLVEILPSIELRFTPDQKTTVPKSEYVRDEESWMFDLRSILKGTPNGEKLNKQIADADKLEKAKAGSNK